MTEAPDPWPASGHHLCERDPAGRLVLTPDLWRAFLARPELVPPPDAPDSEHALHATLLADPTRPIPAADLVALADPDAAENWAVFLAFRDRVAAHPTLEAAYLALFRADVRGIPPLFLQMLTQLVVRAALEGEADPYVLRAAECLFRPQRAAIHQGATLLADADTVADRHTAADLGPLGRLLGEAGAPERAVELDVLGPDTLAAYPRRSDAHDLALDIAAGRDGQHALARALEAFVRHLLAEPVTIRPVPSVADAAWHVGLDTEATRIANALWSGRPVPQAELARILWLAELTFADPSRVLPRAAGRPVILALARDAAGLVRLKPQNLVTGLPLLTAAEAA